MTFAGARSHSRGSQAPYRAGDPYAVPPAANGHQSRIKCLDHFGGLTSLPHSVGTSYTAASARRVPHLLCDIPFRRNIRLGHLGSGFITRDSHNLGPPRDTRNEIWSGHPSDPH